MSKLYYEIFRTVHKYPMRNLINIVQGRPPEGYVDGFGADHASIKVEPIIIRAKKVTESEQVDERILGDRSVETERKVETYRKDSGQIIQTKDCKTNDEAWELANQFKRGATANIGVRIIDITHTTVTTKKVRNIL